jgi:acetyltransferase-like isoleucine patch superfamily enzyme
VGKLRLYWQKRRWYERNNRRLNRLRIERHMLRSGAYVRFPVEGNVLEALDDGRLTIGPGTLVEPGCWLTIGDEGRLSIGEGCFLNRGVMVAVMDRVEIGDHTMLANNCFVGDANHRYDDPELPITWQGFTSKGPTRIGSNCWLGVNCVVTSGVTIGDRCVIGSNSVVTTDIPPWSVAAGSPAKVLREIDHGSR